jgi:hypothetical protein
VLRCSRLESDRTFALTTASSPTSRLLNSKRHSLPCCPVRSPHLTSPHLERADDQPLCETPTVPPDAESARAVLLAFVREDTARMHGGSTAAIETVSLCDRCLFACGSTKGVCQSPGSAAAVDNGGCLCAHPNHHSCTFDVCWPAPQLRAFRSRSQSSVLLWHDELNRLLQLRRGAEQSSIAPPSAFRCHTSS